MKYNSSELNKMWESLQWCLQTVKHTGLCLTWLCALLLCKTAMPVGTMFALSRNVCKDSIIVDWRDAVDALVDFRNEYVHSGTLYVKEHLNSILSIDIFIWESIFDFIEAPGNAREVFREWYKSGVVE